MVLLCLGVNPISAHDQRIFQMIHTAWTARDGAPQNINTMAQTSDGTLWLGTRDGLYSFDGIHFTLFRPVTGEWTRGNVQHLLATKDGFLWAFGPRLLPTRIRDGAVTVFGRVANGSATLISNIQQAADGAMWGILSEKDLVRLGPDGIWRTAAKPKSNQLGALLIDSSDTQ